MSFKTITKKIISAVTGLSFLFSSTVAMANSSELPRLNWVNHTEIKVDKKGELLASPLSGKEFDYAWLDALTSPGNLVSSMDNLTVNSKEVLERSQGKVTASQLVKSFETLAVSAPMVIGQFDPANATLRIDIVKAQKKLSPDGESSLVLGAAQFTPEFGKHWEFARTYATDSQRLSGEMGQNPFVNFPSNTEGLFTKTGLAAVQVIMGHAMRFAGANIGVLSVNVHRMDVSNSTSGNMFKKKVTTTIRGMVKPLWYLVTPSNVGFDSSAGSIKQEAVICISTASPCPESSVVPSMVSMQEVSGDDFESFEQEVYRHTQSESGLTLLSGILIAGLFSFASASLLSTGSGGFFSSIAAEGFPSLGITGLNLTSGGSSLLGSAAQGALIDGIAYGAGAFVFNGADSLTDIQKSSILIGDVKDGTISQATFSGHEANAVNNLKTYSSTSPLTANKLEAEKSVYFGGCAAGMAGLDCAAEKGLLPRVDRYSEKESFEHNAYSINY